MSISEVAAIRGNLACVMRAQGLAYAAIGRALGVSRDRARQIVGAHERRSRVLQRQAESDARDLGGLLRVGQDGRLAPAPGFAPLVWRLTTGRLQLRLDREA